LLFQLSNVERVADKDVVKLFNICTFIFGVLLQPVDCVRVDMLKGINVNSV